MNILITVIVPIYNVGLHVEKCVKSIVNQTYRNLEIILVDDGSTDNCPAILDQLASQDSRIKVIHQVNGGLICARKSGFEAASGKYLFFVDGDDWIEPQAVEKLYKRAQEDDSDITFGLYHSVDDNGKELRKSSFLHQNFSLDQDGYIKAMLDQKISGSACVKLYKRSLFTSESFDYPREHSAAEDHLVNCETFRNIKKAAGIPDVIYNYYMRADSICHTYVPTVEYYLKHYQLGEKAMGTEIASRYKTYHERMFLDIYINLILNTFMVRHISYCGSQPYKEVLAIARKEVVALLPGKVRLKLFLIKYPFLFHAVARAVSVARGRGWFKYESLK